MNQSYGEGVANHTGPESCMVVGNGRREALTGVRAGGVLSLEDCWVLDTDIRGFLDASDHDWMIRMLEHRIGDKRVLRHVRKWLNAGVMEDGNLHQM